MDETLNSDNAADKVRTYRMFTGIASAVLGLEPDQNYANEDAYIGSPFGVHAVADPSGRGAVVQGTSIPFNRTAAGGGFVITPTLILLGLGAWFLLKKGK